MLDVALVLLAFAAAYVGFASLALRQAPHWAAVSRARRGARPAAARRAVHLYRGAAGLVLSFACTCVAEGWSFGVPLWVSMLAATGAGVTFTLTWRPHWLRWLEPSGVVSEP